MNQTILLVDEQAEFRGMVASLLQPTGYVVLEAESFVEALEALSYTEHLALALVDYHLPDGNGITVLSHLRERFPAVPVVFLSDAPLDRETLIYLLNRLNVSLILQKPIQPEAVFLQVETLLPTPEKGKPQQSKNSGVDAAAVAVNGDDSTDVLTADPDDPEKALLVERDLANDAVVRRARAEMASNLPYEWDNLEALLLNLQAEEAKPNSELRSQVLTLLREIRRSATSFGLTAVVGAAEKITECIKLAEAGQAPEDDTAWLQIFYAIAVGNMALKSVTDSSTEAASQEPVNFGYVLMLGGANTLAEPEAGLQPSVGARVIFTETSEKALSKARRRRFDGAVLDVSTLGKQATLALARELRLTSANSALPLAFVTTPDDRLSDVERLYHGCCARLVAPIEQSKFEECLLELAGKHSSSHARVLVIDDDRVLTTLIERVLGNRGMTVYVLNRPLGILEVLEQTHPDVILLDVMMPDVSGYDICRKLRAADEWKETPIIFLTARDDAEGRAAAFEAGANDFLSKPILRDELILRVKTHSQRFKASNNRDEVDQLTGLLSEKTFMLRAHETFIDARRSGEAIVLCFLEIKKFAAVVQANPSVTVAVVNDILSQFGRLLLSLFPSDTLRAMRGDAGFSLLFRKQDVLNVQTAIVMLCQEMAEKQFIDADGLSFSVEVSQSVVSSPEQGLSLVALTNAAQKELRKNRK